MANKRVEIMRIRQLLQQKKKGLSNRKSGRLIGIHRNSVNAYVRLFKASGESYAELLKLSDQELVDLFPSPSSIDKARYASLSSQFEYYRTELKKVGCTRETLWVEYQVQNPDGYSYTQFNIHLNRWLKKKNGSGKLEHKAGEKLFVDYTGKKLEYIDRESGEIVDVEVFVGILPCSQYTFVEASRSQKREDFIGSMNNCLAYFGGVPEAIVPDNLKSAVTKASKYEPVLNKSFADFSLHYGCVINPTRTYSPQDKALVEGAVKLVYQRIFYPLSKMRFFSLEDLNAEIAKILVVYNDQLLSLLGVSRLHQFQSIEQSSLAALPSEKYELKFYKKATVQKMGHIYFSEDKHYYSVPYRYIGRKVELSYNGDVVEIHYNHERIASHKRDYRHGRYSTIKEHLSSSHNFYQDWSPAFFERLAESYGTAVLAYIKGLLAQAKYPETAYKQCLGIINLGKSHDKSRLNNACKRGLKFHQYGYHIIRRILENKMDLQEESSEDASPDIAIHSNIRGPKYFQKLLNIFK